MVRACELCTPEKKHRGNQMYHGPRSHTMMDSWPSLWSIEHKYLGPLLTSHAGWSQPYMMAVEGVVDDPWRPLKLPTCHSRLAIFLRYSIHVVFNCCPILSSKINPLKLCTTACIWTCTCRGWLWIGYDVEHWLQLYTNWLSPLQRRVVWCLAWVTLYSWNNLRRSVWACPENFPWSHWQFYDILLQHHFFKPFLVFL